MSNRPPESAPGLPSVSFVIPTWNRRVDLARLLASIRMQDRTDFETIVVDNGSTDGTAEWLDSAGGTVVRIINRANLGAAYAKNQGIRAARAPWIWFLDSDSELVDPGVLRRALEILDGTDGIGAIGGEMVPDAEGGLQCRVKRHRPNGETFSVMLRGDVHLEPCDYIPTCNCLVRRDLVEAWGGFDPALFIYGEDDELGLALRARGFSCLFDTRLTVAHRITGTARKPALWMSNRNRLRVAVLNFPALRVAGMPLWELREVVRVDNLKILAGLVETPLAARYLPNTPTRRHRALDAADSLAFGFRYAATLAAAYVYSIVTLPRLIGLRRHRPDYLAQLGREAEDARP